MRVDIVVCDGVDEMDVLGLLEVLRECSLEIAERIATRMEYSRFRPAPRPN